MSHEITGTGYWFLTVLQFCITLSVLPCIGWILISNWWVLRRGQFQGLIMWHKHTINTYGFNDAVMCLQVLGLSLLTLLFTIPEPSDPIRAFCTLLSGATFLILAGFVAERRKHWEVLKTSAREVILELSPNQSR